MTLRIIFGIIFAGVWGFAAWYIARIGVPPDSNLLWVITGGAAVLGAAFGVWQAILYQRKHDRFVKAYLSLGNIKDRPLSEIAQVIGNPDTILRIQITDRDDELGYVATWAGSRYHVILLFDSNLHCLCIKSETL